MAQQAQQIDGRALAQKIKQELQQEIKGLCAKHRPPCLAVVLVGDDEASNLYVKNKRAACQEIGIRSINIRMSAKTEERELLAKIDSLNHDAGVDGILVQLPLPAHISAERVIFSIFPFKDVDGLHPINQGLLNSGKAYHLPCTPLGIMQLLHASVDEIVGKLAVVVGRSVLVGLPVSRLLLRADATVMQLHSKTRGSAMLAKTADILLVAAGVPHLVTKDWVKVGAVVIDVGIHRQADGQLTGDVDPSVKEVAGMITPVPGGVGPMTIASLLQNTVRAAQRAHGLHIED